MSLIRKPYEIVVQPKIKALFYGPAGFGKTTLGLSAPKPLLIDCDGGVHRINVAHRTDTLQVNSYNEVLSVLNEDLSEYESIVIDTGGKLLDYMALYVIARNPKLGKQNGALTLQGYGEVKQEFIAFCKLCTSDGSWHKIAVVEDEDVYQQIRKLNVKGIYGNRKYVRKYPSGPLMSHIVGFVNREFQPVMGIERQFQYYLNGQDGWIETERDGRRAEQAQFRKRKVDPADGNNIELSIDLVIQEIVQRQMEKIAAAFHPEKAAIIVSDPATGYILAMSSYPNFDPNNYTKFKNENFLNFVISGQYEPGSTFKIIPVAGALNEGIIGPDDAFDCTATSMMYNGRQVRLPKDDHPLGPRATTRQIIQKSSNRGSAIIGGRLGAARLISYAKAFGIGEKTDIGLSGEISGTLLPLDRWDGLTISRMPIGHAVAVTPLQIHCAMSVIANQGIYMKPQLVKRVYDNKGQTVINYSPRAMRRVISPKVAALMSEMLSTVTISGGTARRAAIKGFEVAGKTGTSQKFIKAKDLPPLPDGTPRKRGEYSNKKHVGSFTGFFPTKAPRLVITVVVDTPKLKGVGYGGIVAAPAFREIGEQIAVYLGIQSDEEFEKKMIKFNDLHSLI